MALGADPGYVPLKCQCSLRYIQLCDPFEPMNWNHCIYKQQQQSRIDTKAIRRKGAIRMIVEAKSIYAKLKEQKHLAMIVYRSKVHSDDTQV